MTDEKPADWRPLVALELVDIDGNTVLVPVTGRAEFGTADSLQAEITVGSGRSIAEVAKHGRAYLPSACDAATRRVETKLVDVAAIGVSMRLRSSWCRFVVQASGDGACGWREGLHTMSRRLN